MIHRAVLSRIDRPAVQGRTAPVLAAIETEGLEEVEVFVKLSAGCDQGVVNLAREAIAACLAADLGLPVPRPVAAAWRRDGLWYRADLVTQRIPSATPLSSRLAQREEVDWRGIGAMLWSFHAAGACHADLNAHNIMLDAAGALWLLDFDRGRFRDAGSWREKNLARLERSLRKIARDPDAPPFSSAGWGMLLAGYAEARRLGLRASAP